MKTLIKLSALTLIAGLSVGCASTSDLAAVRPKRKSTGCSRSRCTSKAKRLTARQTPALAMGAGVLVSSTDNK